MRLAYVDPFSGAAGDMLLGALVDVGVDLAAIVQVLRGLDLGGWKVSAHDVVRGGIGATQVVVEVADSDVVRTWGNVRELLAAAALPAAVRDRAVATFERLAFAEARIHRRDVERVHFHEVGAVDAIIDVVGVCAGLHLLGVEHVVVGPVAQGTGMTRSEHGLLPLPAPAVLEILAGAPTFSAGVTAELCTPTGAALLAEWADAWGPLPGLVVERTGYGAGTRELDRPNVVRVVLGTASGDPQRPRLPGPVLLETAIDDLPGELVPPLLDALRAAGASDAWARQVLMKKGRPGVEVACLVPQERAEAARRVLFEQSSTLGVRGTAVEKWELEREVVRVDVAGHDVAVKVGRLDGKVVNAAPEFSDCARVAAATGLPLKEVFARARAAYGPLPAESGEAEAPGPASA